MCAIGSERISAVDTLISLIPVMYAVTEGERTMSSSRFVSSVLDNFVLHLVNACN